MTDEELMKFAHEWLDTPSMQRNPDWRSIGFIANVCLHWRQHNKISVKQRDYVDAILRKHTYK
jgi:hypothetical protein